jgi:trigger factor
MVSKSNRGRFVDSPLKISPVGLVDDGLNTPLPNVVAPSLDGLEVHVPRPERVSEAQLEEAFADLQRAAATRVTRKPGEAVAMGDELTIDTLGYSAKKLIPFSARFNLKLELAPQKQLPGFAEAIAGENVGDNLEITVNLPADYPVASLRGRSASFLVSIRGAEALTLPDVSKPEGLKRLGKGDTLEKVMAALHEELEVELAQELVLQGQALLFDALLARAKVEVPRALVDAELKRRWVAAEGRLMMERNFTVPQQNEAMQGWLDDPASRADCERRLAISLVLGAIADQEKLSPTQDDVVRLLSSAAAGFGFTPDQVLAALKENKEQTTKLVRTAYHLFAVEYVMGRANIHFDGVSL